MLDVSAAFLPAGGFLLIHHKAVHAHAEIGAEPALVGVKAAEEFPLEQFGVEALGEVLGVGRHPIPPQANVFVDRLPIRRAKGVQCSSALGNVLAARRFNDRPTSGGKAASAGVFIVAHA